MGKDNERWVMVKRGWGIAGVESGRRIRRGKGIRGQLDKMVQQKGD
jgi:hypothetical protein